MKNDLITQIKSIRLNPRYWLSLTVAFSLGIFLVVNYWHYLKHLQTINQTETSHYEKIADQFIRLNNKNGFFSARFDACHKLKIKEICDALYPHEGQSKSQKLLIESEIKKAIKNNKINDLPQISQTRAMKLYPTLSAATKTQIANSLKNTEICFPASFYATIGLFSENQFPNKSAIQKSEAYYTKALSCELRRKKTLTSEYGIYRLGLISYWLKKYDQSLQAFETVIQLGQDPEFQTRASYWVFQIRKNRNLKIDEVEMVKYFTQFPVHYHTVSSFELMNENKAFELITESLPTPTRPNSNVPLIQNSLQLYRELIKRNEITLAMRVLEFISNDQLLESEPDVQLYVAMEMNQSTKFNHQKFQLLSKLFARYPRYKTIENLKVFYPLQYGSIILKASLRADPYLVFGLIRQESSFNTFAESPVGARGLMQIMPRTAQEIRPGVQLESLKNPTVNVQMGSRYLSALIREFKGDVHKALAAYNAGAGNVRRWSKKFPMAEGLLFADLIPYEETREYVAHILRNRYWYQKLYPVIQDEENIAQKSSEDF